MRIPEGARAGKISKPLGIRGEVKVILEPQAGTLIEPGNPLFIEIDGQRVPFFVEELELLSAEQAIIKFSYLDSLEEARELSGCLLHFDPATFRGEAARSGDLRSLVGYIAIDSKGSVLGEITDLIENPANPLLIIQYQGAELMVPASPDFIRQKDLKARRVQLELPEGLLDL